MTRGQAGNLMKKRSFMKQVYRQSFLNSLGVGAYIVLVALFMNNAEKIFGKTDTVFTSVAFLLLLSMSALIVGGLLVGKPIFLYIDGKKKDAVLMLVASACWLLLFLVIALITTMLFK